MIIFLALLQAPIIKIIPQIVSLFKTALSQSCRFQTPHSINYHLCFEHIAFIIPVASLLCDYDIKFNYIIKLLLLLHGSSF